jgi:integrase
MSDTLRTRFMEEMTARGYAARTRDSYLSDVALMVKRLGRHPALVADRDVTGYLSWLLTVHKVSTSTYRQHVGAIKLFFGTVMHRDLPVLRDARPPKRLKLPAVLSEAEVPRLLRSIRLANHRMAATVAYGCGLRRSEVLAMRPDWIESEGRRLHVRNGKGGGDRMVPMPPRILQLLREYWANEKLPGPLFFPSRLFPLRCVSGAALCRAVREAAREAGIRQRVTMHTVRHCYATHLMQHGVDTRVIQRFLGHKSPETTAIYAHLTVPTLERASAAIDELTRSL